MQVAVVRAMLTKPGEPQLHNKEEKSERYIRILSVTLFSDVEAVGD